MKIVNLPSGEVNITLEAETYEATLLYNILYEAIDRKVTTPKERELAVELLEGLDL